MGKAKDQNSQHNPKEEEHRGLTLPNFKTYYSYSNENNTVLVKEQTTRSMEQNTEPRNRLTQI